MLVVMLLSRLKRKKCENDQKIVSEEEKRAKEGTKSHYRPTHPSTDRTESRNTIILKNIPELGGRTQEHFSYYSEEESIL